MTDEQALHDSPVRASPADAMEPAYSDYGFIRSRQLEGTYPGDAETGTWIITAKRVACGWGIVPEADFPRTRTWPPTEPPGLDAKAKALRIPNYQRVRSASDCSIMLGYQFSVRVALEITKQWFEAENGVIRMPDPEEPMVGSHAVQVIGFDILYGGFVFRNSWGQRWGNRGFGLLPVEYFDKYLVSAWTQHDPCPLPEAFAYEGVDTVSWGQLDGIGNSLHGGDAMHGREVYDGSNDERMAWTFAVHRDGFLDVEELFVRPQYRRQGYGSQLVDMILKLADELKRPLRLWVPFADWTPSNLPVVKRIVEKLGLRLFHADARWAAAMALDPTALPHDSQTEAERHET